MKRIGLVELMTSVHRYRYPWLLASLVLIWLGNPLVGTSLVDRVVLGLLFLLVLIAAVWAATGWRGRLWLTAVLAGVCFALTAVGIVFDHVALFSIGRLGAVAYIVFTIIVVLRHILSAREVDANILCGAVAVYLLIAVAWAMTYWVIDDVFPGAFSASAASPADARTFHHFMFFSLVTLTTVGYGDIVPVAPFAQAWSSAEAVLGTLYIAVLVARLVGLYRR